MHARSLTVLWLLTLARAHDNAYEAYQSALKFLGSEFSDSKHAREILSGKTSTEDVEATVRMIKDGYEMRSERKRDVCNWLQKLSGRIMYYSGVLDALAQHHPEYVSLAWGTIKFVLMVSQDSPHFDFTNTISKGIINQAELVEQFARALTIIGYALPEIRRDSELYTTGQMQDAVSTVYAYIIAFLLRAAAWYKKHTLRRAFSSIFKPFELEYRSTLEKVKKHSEIVRRIASGEGRTEIRDINITVHQIQEQNHQLQQELVEIRSQFERLLEDMATNTTIVKRIDMRVEDIQPRIYDLQYSDIVAALRPSSDPEELLHGSTSLIRRRKMKSVYPCTITPVLDRLKAWVACPASSLLILRPGPGANSAAKEVSVDIINHVKSAKVNIFWNLSPLGSDGTVPSITGVLKSLVFQVITRQPDVLLRASHELNVAKFTSTHSEDEWIHLLSIVISRARGCFLIVECESLCRACSEDPGWTPRFLKLFHQLADKVQASGSRVKIFVTDFEKTLVEQEDLSGTSPRIVAALKRPRPVPPRRRKAFHSNYRRGP